MHWTELSIAGCFTIEVPRNKDQRGSFIKTLNSSLIREVCSEFQALEAFTTVSKRHVLRGMHYQAVPYDHDKVVSISRGKAHDVLVDLRSGTDFGKVCSIDMQASDTCTVVFVARGVAHGFCIKGHLGTRCFAHGFCIEGQLGTRGFAHGLRIDRFAGRLRGTHGLEGLRRTWSPRAARRRPMPRAGSAPGRGPRLTGRGPP